MQEVAEIVLLSEYHTLIDVSLLKGNSSTAAHAALESIRSMASCMQLLLNGRMFLLAGSD